MNRPPEPPAYGLLIESARKTAGLSVREAAKRAGISDAWWRYVVRGYQNLSGGGYGQMTGPAETVAAMARVVGLDPGRLEAEGQRPDAAEIMRAEPPRPQLVRVPPLERDSTDPAAEILADLVARYPSDTVIAAIAGQFGKPARTRVAEVLEWLEVSGAHRDNGTAGLRDTSALSVTEHFATRW